MSLSLSLNHFGLQEFQVIRSYPKNSVYVVQFPTSICEHLPLSLFLQKLKLELSLQGNIISYASTLHDHH